MEREPKEELYDTHIYRDSTASGPARAWKGDLPSLAASRSKTARASAAASGCCARTSTFARRRNHWGLKVGPCTAS